MLVKTVCLQKFAQLCLRVSYLFAQRVQAQLTGKADSAIVYSATSAAVIIGVTYHYWNMGWKAGCTIGGRVGGEGRGGGSGGWVPLKEKNYNIACI